MDAGMLWIIAAGLLEPVLQGELLRQICAAGFVLVGFREAEWTEKLG